MNTLPKNTVVFSLSFHKWGNQKKGDKSEIQSEANKKMLKVSKVLLDSKEYESIGKFYTRVSKYINEISVPSFFHKGTYILRDSLIQDVEDYLQGCISELKEMVDNFLSVYIVKINEAEILLGPQFNRADYPSVSYLRESFGITWKWLKFDIPENLPDEVFQKEKTRVESAWQEAEEAIKDCLRSGFLSLIQKATEKLTIKQGEKPKIFHDTLIENIKAFFETFNNRNVVNDIELQKLVEKAKAITSNISDIEQLRKDVSYRAKVNAEFQTVENELSKMVVAKPSRKFDISLY